MKVTIRVETVQFFGVNAVKEFCFAARVDMFP